MFKWNAEGDHVKRKKHFFFLTTTESLAVRFSIHKYYSILPPIGWYLNIASKNKALNFFIVLPCDLHAVKKNGGM